MRTFIAILLICFFFSCKNNNSSPDRESGLLNISYTNYKDVDLWKDYKKISDTAFIKSGSHNTHRITQLEKNDTRLILFAKIEVDENTLEENITVIDTLAIRDLSKNQKVTIGYCETENYLMEEIIAIVEKTNRDTIQHVVKTWVANHETNRIESMDNSNVSFCYNAR